jgi:PAS domain S-box-containing protein
LKADTSLSFLSGGGDLAALIDAHDWWRSPLGPPEGWSPTLKAAAAMMLPADSQIVLFWGPEFVALYNDAYSPTIGDKHPGALGRPAREYWAELWDDLEPLLLSVRETGKTVSAKDRPFYIERHGFPETVYFDISYSAVRNAHGAIEGVLCLVNETTERVVAERTLRQSEERLRIATDAAAIGTWDFDPINGTLRWDNRCKALFGLPPDAEVDYDTFLAGLHPDDREATDKAVQTALDSEGPGSYDVEYRTIGHPDGVERWIAATGRAFFEGAGRKRRAIRFIGTVIDITERKQTEAAIREGEARFRNMADHSPVMVWVTEPDGRCTYLNKAWYEFTGQVPGDAEGFGWLDAVHPDDRVWSGEAFVKANKEQGPFRVEYRLRRHDGAYRWAIDAAAPRFGSGGEYLGYIGSVIDIDERREVEDALVETTRRLNAIINNTEMAVFLMDDRQHCEFANAAAEQLTGYRFEEMQGRPLHDVIHNKYPDGRHYPLEECPIDRAFPAKNQVRGEECFVHKDGHFYPVGFTASPVRDDSGNAVGTVIEARNIAEEKNQESALREERYRLDTLNRTGAAIAAELDLKRVVQMVTDAGVELTGAQFGAFFYNVINDSGEEYMLFTLSGAERSQFENFEMPRNTKIFAPTFNGEGVVRSDDITKDPRYGQNPPHKGMPEGHLPVRSYLAVPVTSRSGEVIGGLFFGNPEPGCFNAGHELLMTGLAAQAAISIDNARLYQAVQRAKETLEHRVQERTVELETANEALRQAQKMEAIGQLTGGIAHDFNNMLTVIRGSADVLQRGEIDEAKRQRYIQAIADTSDRAARLTSQLLAFARRQALRPEVFDVTERVRAIADMLRTVIGPRINLHVEGRCEDCFVETDAAQFETALVNMAVNARDAMDGEGDLHIVIDTAKSLRSSGPPVEAGYVTVSVVDTGHGIPPADLDRIFEPFFTTKETGKGTGLGLSQVYGFAKQSGGEIEVRSETGAGTTFTMYLPRVSSGRRPAKPSQPGARRSQAEGRVLVVEDNADVGAFAEQALADLGFETHRATTAAEALALLEGGNEFDVVFSDIVMPGQSGIDLARVVRQRWPDLPFVLTTGYSDALAMQHEHSFPVLHKPYSLDALSAALGKAVKT